MIAIYPLLGQILFFTALAGTALVSAILVYHWHKYGRGNWLIRLAETIYFIGSLVLLGLALMALGLIVV